MKLKFIFALLFVAITLTSCGSIIEAEKGSSLIVDPITKNFVNDAENHKITPRGLNEYHVEYGDYKFTIEDDYSWQTTNLFFYCPSEGQSMLIQGTERDRPFPFTGTYDVEKLYTLIDDYSAEDKKRELAKCIKTSDNL